jgi:hypothetical protein
MAPKNKPTTKKSKLRSNNPKNSNNMNDSHELEEAIEYNICISID